MNIPRSHGTVLEVYPSGEGRNVVFKWGEEFRRMDLAEKLECLTQIRIEIEKSSQEISREFSEFASKHRFE